MNGMKVALAALGSIVLVVLLAIGGWQLGWWMNEEGTNRRARISNDSFARQTALAEDVLDKYRTALDIDVQLSEATEHQRGPLEAQRKAVVVQLCDSYAQMTGTTTIPASAEAFALKECS